MTKQEKQIPYNTLSRDYVLRVALYIRVSTEEQALFGGSLIAQEEALVQYAKENNMRVVKIYRDEGVSGGKPIFKRPALSEMLEDVKAGKIDLILFTKLDRYFRNVREYFKAQEILENNKCAWKAINENYDTITANGEMAVTMFLAIAEAERKRTSERIKFVFDSKRKRKELAFGGGTRPLGYKAERIDGILRLVKDPETEPIVQDFWDHVRKYNSVRLAGMFCNEKHGIARTYKSWMDLARTELYTGTHRGVEDYCPAYITHEEWEYLSQSNIPIKKTQRPDRIYLFTGLLRCPKCGGTLKATFKTYPGDRMKEYHMYRCNNRYLNTCGYRRAVSGLKLEKFLLQNIREELSNFVMSAEVAEEKKKKPSAAMDIVKLTEQLRRLNVVYMGGNIPDDEYIAETTAIKKKIEQAREAEKEDRPPDLEVLKQFLNTDFEAIYKDLDPMDKRRMWRSIISEICFEEDSNKVRENGIVFRA